MSLFQGSTTPRLGHGRARRTGSLPFGNKRPISHSRGLRPSPLKTASSPNGRQTAHRCHGTTLVVTTPLSSTTHPRPFPPLLRRYSWRSRDHYSPRVFNLSPATPSTLTTPHTSGPPPATPQPAHIADTATPSHTSSSTVISFGKLAETSWAPPPSPTSSPPALESLASLSSSTAPRLSCALSPPKTLPRHVPLPSQ